MMEKFQYYIDRWWELRLVDVSKNEERVYIIAENYYQAKYYMEKLGINFRSYIDISRQLRGLHNVKILLCGRYWARKDWLEIYKILGYMVGRCKIEFYDDRLNKGIK